MVVKVTLIINCLIPIIIILTIINLIDLHLPDLAPTLTTTAHYHKLILLFCHLECFITINLIEDQMTSFMFNLFV